MSFTCVVQARMASRRLPGKVLAELAGRPMLAFQLRRLAPLDAEHLVVATTTDPGDDAVADVGRAAGTEVVRGSEQDVLARFAVALERFPALRIVRITADCPLIDPELVREALRIQSETGADYVSNTLVRTFPDGLDVEVLTADALRAADAEAVDPIEREHVTPFVYRRPERFTLRSLRHRENLGHLRWTVDTREDLEQVREIVERVRRDDFGWREALSAADDSPGSDGGWSITPATRDDADAVLALRNEPEAIRWSRSPRPVDPAEHAEWFAGVLDDPATRLWITRDAGERIGQMRVDVRAGVGEVSVVVDPPHRGRGVARRMLAQLDAELAGDEQVHTLTAAVHSDNEPSRRLFRRAGFAEVGNEGEFVLMRRARPAPSAHQ